MTKEDDRRMYNDKDERVCQIRNEIGRKLLPWISVLIMLECILAYSFNMGYFWSYLIDGVALVASIGYVIIREVNDGILFLSDSDECIVKLKDKYRTHGFFISLCTILMFNLWEIVIQGFGGLQVLIFLPMLLVYNNKMKKSGVMVFGSKRAENKNRNIAIIIVIFATLSFGIIQGVHSNELLLNGKVKEGIFAGIYMFIVIYVFYILRFRSMKKIR